MATKIDEGLEVFDLTTLDWDHAPVCEAEWTDTGPCKEPADFLCGTRCCAWKMLMCEDCFFEMREWMKGLEGDHVCFHCLAEVTDPVNLIKILKRIS